MYSPSKVMDVFIGERITNDTHIKRSLENIVYNTIYKGQFEMYRQGENILVNITNSHYLNKETQLDLIYQIKTMLNDCDCNKLIYTYGKYDTIIYS